MSTVIPFSFFFLFQFSSINYFIFVHLFLLNLKLLNKQRRGSEERNLEKIDVNLFLISELIRVRATTDMCL